MNFDCNTHFSEKLLFICNAISLKVMIDRLVIKSLIYSLLRLFW